MTFSAKNSSEQATNSTNNGAHRKNAKSKKQKARTKTKIPKITKLNVDDKNGEKTKTKAMDEQRRYSIKSNDKTVVNYP